MGGGAAQITSVEAVNDGKEHHLKALRKGRNGSLQVDYSSPVEGVSSGILAMLNVDGDIYVGEFMFYKRETVFEFIFYKMTSTCFFLILQEVFPI